MAMETSAPEPDANRIEVDNKRLYMKNVWYWSHKNASCLCLGFCLFFGWWMDMQTRIQVLTNWITENKVSLTCEDGYFRKYVLNWKPEGMETTAWTSRAAKDKWQRWQYPTWQSIFLEFDTVTWYEPHVKKNNGMFFSTPTTFLILKRNSDLLFEPRLKQQPDAWLTWMASSATTSARSLLVDMSFVYYLSYLRYHKGSSS